MKANPPIALAPVRTDSSAILAPAPDEKSAIPHNGTVCNSIRPAQRWRNIAITLWLVSAFTKLPVSRWVRITLVP